MARRSLVVLLLADGCSYRAIGKAALASPTLVRNVKRDFTDGGMTRVLRAEPQSVPMASWLIVVVRWLMQFTPKDFGYFRSRWSCALLAWLLREQEGICRSAETIRRGLVQLGFVWRRPRPIVGPQGPEHARKLRRIQRLVARLPDNETVVFQDEVDVHLNPKIGSCWMPCGARAEVGTPGTNDKRHLAGSLHWRTGTLLLSEPHGRRNA